MRAVIVSDVMFQSIEIFGIERQIYIPFKCNIKMDSWIEQTQKRVQQQVFMMAVMSLWFP
jgi:hypothetical protein